MTYEGVIKAIDEFFTDQSLSPKEMLDGLREIRDHVEICVDALEGDMGGI